MWTDGIKAHLELIRQKVVHIDSVRLHHERKPYFCSGCPHNTSTRVPDGSRAMAGIGCHYMATFMPERKASTYTQMGGEGTPWIGQAPFTSENHIFANIGDGTYFHSGILAIRAAVAANVNITYKLLFNDAVAMTGGQAVDGALTVQEATRQLAAEGVQRIVLMSDDIEKWHGHPDLAPGIQLEGRKHLNRVQQELREIEGVTVLVYEQGCAANKRRFRKRGTMPDPPKRVFINERVCEGCGDCNRQSTCLSVEPIDTEFGTKRRINQSSCNKDYSCLNGFCPSMVTVHGGELKTPEARDPDTFLTDIPNPEQPAIGHRPYAIQLTGIGGTGVSSVAGILGMAAHLEGKEICALDMTGLAQKGGAVVSHIRIGESGQSIFGPKLGVGATHLLLACDMVTASHTNVLDATYRHLTRAVINDDVTPLADITSGDNVHYDDNSMVGEIAKAVQTVDHINATAAAEQLLGDTIFANMLLVGFAYQKGHVPLGADAIEKAIELNGAAVAKNIKAFRWGRALTSKEVQSKALTVPVPVQAHSLDQLIERRSQDLVQYQNQAYARTYESFVQEARQAEAAATGKDVITTSVARYLYKLMAYKDEYEVARLYTDKTFLKQVNAAMAGDFKIQYHLAPPLLSKANPETGRPDKVQFGAWMGFAFGLLKHCKMLRGTWADPFGHTSERQMERRLIKEYKEQMRLALSKLTLENEGVVRELAETPREIRGYGRVKEESVTTAQAKTEALLNTLDSNRLAAAAE